MAGLPPPPTTNKLSQGQRSRLLQSTNKLGRLLGSTPHLLEPVSVSDVSGSESRRGRSTSASRTPADSTLASSRSATPSSISSFSSRASSSVSSRTHSSSNTYSSSSSANQYSSSRDPMSELRTHHPLHRPPLLRLAQPTPLDFPTRAPTPHHSVAPSLSPVLASPSYPDSPTDASPRVRGRRQGYTLPTPTDAHFSSADREVEGYTPSFAIQTEAAEKRVKLARVTRKLGSGVPTELVFPPSPTRSSRPMPPSVPFTVSTAGSLYHHDTTNAPPTSRKDHTRTRQRSDHSNAPSLAQAPTASARSRKDSQSSSSGWKGMWNRRDFDAVNAGLRSLRRI